METSPDPVDWTEAGTAEDNGNGDFIFDDENSADLAARYYRVATH